MPEYEFGCRGCRKVFTVVMRIGERATGKIRCPGCRSADIEPLMQRFVAKAAKKS